MASPILRLTLAIFRAMPTSIGCVPGRNQRFQWVTGFGEVSVVPFACRFRSLNHLDLHPPVVPPAGGLSAESMIGILHVERISVKRTKCGSKFFCYPIARAMAAWEGGRGPLSRMSSGAERSLRCWPLNAHRETIACVYIL